MARRNWRIGNPSRPGSGSGIRPGGGSGRRPGRQIAAGPTGGICPQSVTGQWGRQVLLTTRSSPYFTRPEAGGLIESVYDEEIERTARLHADGLFRVWSTDLEEIPHSGVRMFHGDYPLTAEAEARRAAWDAGDSSPAGMYGVEHAVHHV